jgi:hypothetical protein
MFKHIRLLQREAAFLLIRTGIAIQVALNKFSRKALRHYNVLLQAYKSLSYDNITCAIVDSILPYQLILSMMFHQLNGHEIYSGDFVIESKLQ